MEQLITNLIENSLVGGAFIFLLYQFVTKFTATQEKIVGGLTDITQAMTEISVTLRNLDDRVRELEEREENK